MQFLSANKSSIDFPVCDLRDYEVQSMLCLFSSVVNPANFSGIDAAILF